MRSGLDEATFRRVGREEQRGGLARNDQKDGNVCRTPDLNRQMLRNALSDLWCDFGSEIVVLPKMLWASTRTAGEDAEQYCGPYCT